MKVKDLRIHALALLLMACGNSESFETPELQAVPVTVAVAEVMNEPGVISASGRIEAGSSANLSTRIMGNVSGVKVKSGDKVRKGDLLLTISSSDLLAKRAQVEASISQAQSGFINAKNDWERFKVLFEKGSASKKELENMTTRYEMAKSGLEAAKQMKQEINAQFAYTNIRAPFDGLIANTFVKEGDMASPGMPLITVEGTTDFQATVLVAESQIGKIEKGSGAIVLVKSTGAEYQGTVVEVSPSAKNTGGQFITKIDIKDSKDVLPGMFVNAKILTEGQQKESSPLVKKSSLISNGQLQGIYYLSEQKTAVLRWVRTGKSIDDKIEILSGIRDGEKYIVKAAGKLFNGATVVETKQLTKNSR